jgi:hypothetical protein
MSKFAADGWEIVPEPIICQLLNTLRPPGAENKFFQKTTAAFLFCYRGKVKFRTNLSQVISCKAEEDGDFLPFVPWQFYNVIFSVCMSPGKKVLDINAETGSSVVASHVNQLHCTAIESNENLFKILKTRIANVYNKKEVD